VNVLSDDKKQQVLALGRLGWTLRDIEEAVGVRRETASGYLKAAGVAVRAPRARRRPPPVATAEPPADGDSKQRGCCGGARTHPRGSQRSLRSAFASRLPFGASRP
jgi:hypothetical protein